MFFFVFFSFLNKYFIPKKGRNKRTGSNPISIPSLQNRRRQIRDGNRPRPTYKSCPLGQKMGRDIALSTNKRKLYVLYFKRTYVQHWNYVLVWIATCLCLCWHLRFLVDSCALFMRLASMKKNKSNFKIGSHDTIHTFKNYFAVAFSVFNNKQYPNRSYISVTFCLFLGSQDTIYGTANFNKT